MLLLHPRDPEVWRTATVLDACAACGTTCRAEPEALVSFCDECLEASDLSSYPEGWVMLGGGD
jgi:hypothetical protein